MRRGSGLCYWTWDMPSAGRTMAHARAPARLGDRSLVQPARARSPSCCTRCSRRITTASRSSSSSRARSVRPSRARARRRARARSARAASCASRRSAGPARATPACAPRAAICSCSSTTTICRRAATGSRRHEANFADPNCLGVTGRFLDDGDEKPYANPERGAPQRALVQRAQVAARLRAHRRARSASRA